VWNARGIFVNEALAVEGLARVEVVEPNRARLPAIQLAALHAAIEKVGMNDPKIECAQAAAAQEAASQAAAARTAAKAAADQQTATNARAAALAAAAALTRHEAAAKAERMRHLAAVKAAQARHTAERAARRLSQTTHHPTHTSSDPYPGYTGPRCYAPGGRTYKPC
jgi:micrococcal nuclease